jgi:hypothetical protein
MLMNFLPKLLDEVKQLLKPVSKQMLHRVQQLLILFSVITAFTHCSMLPSSKQFPHDQAQKAKEMCHYLKHLLNPQFRHLPV